MGANMQIKFKPWITPNFAHVEGPLGRRQEGVSFDRGFALSEIPVEDLAELCDQFRADVFRKAGRPDPAAGVSPTEGGGR
jgi:hypothetical protein